MIKLEFFIALKHIKRKKFQTFISVFSVFISLTIFITSLLISNSLKSNMLNSILGIGSHITITKDFKENEYKEIIENIKQKGIDNISKNIYMNSIIKKNNNTIVSNLHATDLINLKFMELEKKEYNSIDFAYIGEEFSKHNNIYIDDDVNVIALNGREINLKIKGIFKTGFLAFDKNLVIVPIEIGQILQNMGDTIDSLSIRVNNPENIENLDLIRNKITDIDNDLMVYTWAEENISLLSAIKLENFILILILSMLFIISSFIISIVLNIIVREKTRDIGILRTFGYTKKTIQNIFILEGMILGTLGMILSMIFTPFILYVIKKLFKTFVQNTYYISELKIVYDYKIIVYIYLFSIIIIFLSSYIPAKKAAKLEPMEAIRYNL